MGAWVAYLLLVTLILLARGDHRRQRCLGGCGRLIFGRYCSTCKPSGNTGGYGRGRNRATQDRFRKAVLARDDYRCVYVDNGKRCEVEGSANVVAHHDEPGNDDPGTGRTLCRPHHSAVDSHAR